MLALVLLTALTVLLAIAAPAVLRRPVVAFTVMAMLAAFVLVRWPTPGWPASGWALAMCDVGQGDALVLNAGPGSGVVVDAGPDPALVDDCLRRLGIDEVPLLVLTHFHADHVDGLAGVVDGRRVGAVLTTRVLDPPGGVEEVADWPGPTGWRPARRRTPPPRRTARSRCRCSAASGTAGGGHW